ncbi:MAG: triose-phosphate isomerase [Oscillospiraceae bacterium]|nr:triose-phosphate isomerase [Oscillospiraceae bacterium]
MIPRPPFFEVGVKNYLYGDNVLALALAADEAAKRCDIDVLFIAPYMELRRVAERTDRLIVLAPYMDTLRPGPGMTDVLPEAVAAAGAKGVVINHCERPMSLSAIRRTMLRANELGLFTFVCADTIAEAKAVAELGPDILNPELTERIGAGQGSDPGYVRASIQAVKSVNPKILVEQAAGITSGQQVYELLMAGAEGVGAASGVCAAPDPCAALWDMVLHAQKARDALRARRLRMEGEGA